MRATTILSIILLALFSAAHLLHLPAVMADNGADDDAPPGSITFVGKNMVATANGTFHKWRFTQAEFNPSDPSESVVEIEVDVASIDTKIEKRDDHLRTADFFDVETYPTATLRIYDIKTTGTGSSGNPTYTAKLDWTMHGVEKTYEDFTFEVVGVDPVRVKGTFTINRMDFDIGEEHKTLNPMSIQEEIPIAFEAVVPEAV